jgi:hypothetical protein
MNGANGGGPDWKSIFYLMVLLGSIGFKMGGAFDSSSFSKEVTYIDFINEYLAKNRIKLVTIG